MALTNQEFAAANARGREMLRTTPHAVAARYDEGRDRIVVELSNRLELAFAPGDAQGLETATAEDLAEIVIDPPGFGLHFPKLDADLYVPALLDGVFGSKAWTAARMGQEGGKSRTPAKQEASRANGRLGGRPRKMPVAPEPPHALASCYLDHIPDYPSDDVPRLRQRKHARRAGRQGPLAAGG